MARLPFLSLSEPVEQDDRAGNQDDPAADSAPVFAPPEYLLFARQGALMAQRWDWARLELSGDPSSLAGRVLLDTPGYFSIALSASSAGPLAYRSGGGERQLVWLDRSGRQIDTVGGPDVAAQTDAIRLSPDGRPVALVRMVGGNRDVWLIETVRGALRRFTFDGGRDSEPIWSPDGSRIVLASLRNGLPDFYEKPVSGTGTETLLFASSEFKNIFDWSADGRFILYTSQTPKAGRDLWALPLFGDRKPFLVAQTPFEETEGRFSPDGRWIAYQSNESGRTEIYVKPFPGSGGRSQVSTDGGTNAQWGRDGRELFYRAGQPPDGRACHGEGPDRGSWNARSAIFHAPWLAVRRLARRRTLSRQHDDRSPLP